MNIEAKDVLIRMLATPNPYALKFVLNVPLKNKGRATFYSKEDCSDLPLFHSLFDISGVKQIFVFQNQMTFTHDGSLSEQDIEKQVTAVIGTRIAVHNPDFLSFEEREVPVSSSESPKKEKSPEVLKVEQILDRTVRPGLQADGGDLEVLSVDENEVRISYQGACGGCPSAMMGTLEAIENILRYETGKENLKVIPI
ncbi:MAG: NifU family protein [Bdellovibrionales bacterium]|nr:NifU family protein [Bdellovibrionales bacterium]